MDRTTKIMSIIFILLMLVVLGMWKFDVCGGNNIGGVSFWADIIKLPAWMKVR